MSGCSWGWLRVGGKYVWCGESGPTLGAPGVPGDRPPPREQPAWGALGKAERAPGGRRGLRARLLCVLGNARERQLQPALKVARLLASRHPGGRSGTSPTDRGGAPSGRPGASPGPGSPANPQALPQASGVLPRGLAGGRRPPRVAARPLRLPAREAATARSYGGLVPQWTAQK